jgi:hypothetical protein
MSKKADKFSIFGKKFVKLDDEGQDKLVKAARELLKVHSGMKDNFYRKIRARGFENAAIKET